VLGAQNYPIYDPIRFAKVFLSPQNHNDAKHVHLEARSTVPSINSVSTLLSSHNASPPRTRIGLHPLRSRVVHALALDLPAVSSATRSHGAPSRPCHRRPGSTHGAATTGSFVPVPFLRYAGFEPKTY